ncbi:Rossmann-fold NAD(P)-binding domain-containing protein [Coxiella endosymbiont of Ornithodoros maritimus]|uniref:hypothetical protein n=1 Tax=Coxiella endosymbiont of Ornithodoros maritimus TaxID=1656172 RepID=UPI00226535C6|nr:hypothetical protein [Coxiella endosymbiont of Ornithodoros maritimus]
MVNGALDGFVKSAAFGMPKGLRINAVSPTVITEALPVYEVLLPRLQSRPARRSSTRLQ